MELTYFFSRQQQVKMIKKVISLQAYNNIVWNLSISTIDHSFRPHPANSKHFTHLVKYTQQRRHLHSKSIRRSFDLGRAKCPTSPMCGEHYTHFETCQHRSKRDAPFKHRPARMKIKGKRFSKNK